jgi:hypothetical protein
LDNVRKFVVVFYRFADPRNETQPFDPETLRLAAGRLLVGGVEHAILHLITRAFSRGVSWIWFVHHDEPFTPAHSGDGAWTAP